MKVWWGRWGYKKGKKLLTFFFLLFSLYFFVWQHPTLFKCDNLLKVIVHTTTRAKCTTHFFLSSSLLVFSYIPYPPFLLLRIRQFLIPDVDQKFRWSCKSFLWCKTTNGQSWYVFSFLEISFFIIIFAQARLLYTGCLQTRLFNGHVPNLLVSGILFWTILLLSRTLCSCLYSTNTTRRWFRLNSAGHWNFTGFDSWVYLPSGPFKLSFLWLLQPFRVYSLNFPGIYINMY